MQKLSRVPKDNPRPFISWCFWCRRRLRVPYVSTHWVCGRCGGAYAETSSPQTEMPKTPAV
jgi:hypothetical protein